MDARARSSFWSNAFFARSSGLVARARELAIVERGGANSDKNQLAAGHMRNERLDKWTGDGGRGKDQSLFLEMARTDRRCDEWQRD